MKDSINEDLILYYYGELDDLQIKAVEKRLASSPKMRHELVQLQQLLTDLPESPIPSRSSEFSTSIWFKVAQKLELTDQLSNQGISTVKPDGSHSTNARFTVKPSALLGNLLPKWATLRIATVTSIVLISVFTLGRLSSFNPSSQQKVENSIVDSIIWNESTQRNVLLHYVVEHLAELDALPARLEQTVSLSGEQEPTEPASGEPNQRKTPLIDAMLADNLFYQLSAEQQGDYHLLQVLVDYQALLFTLRRLKQTSADSDSVRDFRALLAQNNQDGFIYRVRFMQRNDLLVNGQRKNSQPQKQIENPEPVIENKGNVL